MGVACLRHDRIAQKSPLSFYCSFTQVLSYDQKLFKADDDDDEDDEDNDDDDHGGQGQVKKEKKNLDGDQSDTGKKH